MKKIIQILSIFLYSITALQAQKSALDEIYLKDGSVIVGQVQSISDQQYKITVAGGSLLVIDRTETDSLKLNTREDNWMSPSGKLFVIDQKGWYNRTSFGLSLGNPNSYYSSAGGLFISNVTGYKINRFFQPGVAISGETASGGLSPVVSAMAHAEGELLKESVTPFYFGQLGYGFPVGAPGQDIIEETGGLSAVMGTGVKFYGEKSTLWFIGVAYRHQRGEYVRDQWNGGTIESEVRLNRFALSVGYEF